MSPLNQAIDSIQEEQQIVQLAVQAIAQASGQNRLLAVELLQQALKTENLPQPVHAALTEDVNRANQIDVLDMLWDLQTNLIWNKQPAERVHRMKLVIAKYWGDTGIQKYCPEITDALWLEVSGYTDSARIMKFFHRHYPNWVRIQFAIQDGLINSPLDYFKWKVHQPQPFRFGMRTLQRLSLIRQMPPIYREGMDTDSEYGVDLFASRARAVVRSEQ